MTSCVQRAASAAPRENSSSDSSPVTARSWLPARQTSACSRDEPAAVVGVGAVADEVAQAPDLLAPGCAAMSASTASKAWRLPWMSETMATCMDLAAGLGRGAFLTNVERPRRLPWPWLRPSSSRRPRSCCCGRVTASSRPCRSTPDRTSRPPSSTARATTAARSSRSTARRWRSRRRCSCWLVRRPPARLRGAIPPACARRRGGRRRRSRSAWPRRRCRRARHAPALDRRRAGRPSSWGGWAGRRGQVDGDRGGRSPASAPAAALALMRRFPRRWWLPGSVRRRRLPARRSSTPGPVVLDPLFNRFTTLPEGRTRGDVLELAREAGRRGRPGLRGRREPPHDRRQRLRHRPGPHQARRPLRHLLRTSAATRRGSSSRTSSGTSTTATCRAGCSTWLLVAPRRRCSPPRGRRAAWRRGRAAGAGPAALPALALRSRSSRTRRHRRRNQLSRRVEARADSFALRLTDAPAPFIGFQQRGSRCERRRPRPAGDRRRCSAPTRRRCSGSGSRRPTRRGRASALALLVAVGAAAARRTRAGS